MGTKAKKGSQFEREFCRQLSLWWSGGREDDLFWRTSNSGGRATTRHKKGKATRAHYGDVSATDDDGKPFTQMFCVELKRGYNRSSIQDLMDPPKRKGSIKKPLYQQWFEKASDTSEKAGALCWLLVVRRDHRIPIVFMPNSIAKDLYLHPQLRFCSIVCMTLEAFFEQADPDNIRSHRCNSDENT